MILSLLFESGDRTNLGLAFVYLNGLTDARVSNTTLLDQMEANLMVYFIILLSLLEYA
jgi:hypothetical protein